MVASATHSQETNHKKVLAGTSGNTVSRQIVDRFVQIYCGCQIIVLSGGTPFAPVSGSDGQRCVNNDVMQCVICSLMLSKLLVHILDNITDNLMYAHEVQDNKELLPEIFCMGCKLKLSCCVRSHLWKRQCQCQSHSKAWKMLAQ